MIILTRPASLKSASRQKSINERDWLQSGRENKPLSSVLSHLPLGRCITNRIIIVNAKVYSIKISGACKDLKAALPKVLAAFIVAGYPHYTFRRASFAPCSWWHRKLASWHGGKLEIMTLSWRSSMKTPCPMRHLSISYRLGSHLPEERICPLTSLAWWSLLCHLARIAELLSTGQLVSRAAL